MVPMCASSGSASYCSMQMHDMHAGLYYKGFFYFMRSGHPLWHLPNLQLNHGSHQAQRNIWSSELCVTWELPCQKICNALGVVGVESNAGDREFNAARPLIAPMHHRVLTKTLRSQNTGNQNVQMGHNVPIPQSRRFTMK